MSWAGGGQARAQGLTQYANIELRRPLSYLIEGGVAQAIGAALHDKMLLDERGAIANPTFRCYHIPAFADIPVTEVYFATTYDRVGPLGAKSMSESPFNPIAAALANAVRDATGVRITEKPIQADRLYRHCLAPQEETANEQSEVDALACPARGAD